MPVLAHGGRAALFAAWALTELIHGCSENEARLRQAGGEWIWSELLGSVKRMQLDHAELLAAKIFGRGVSLLWDAPSP